VRERVSERECVSVCVCERERERYLRTSVSSRGKSTSPPFNENGTYEERERERF
jgi:hypothetical protein